MQVGLKIWRYDSATGDRALREYEIEAPEEATLLDCLDIVKDRHDGSLAYRKSCRMMICGSCGLRMGGAAALARKTRGHATRPDDDRRLVRDANGRRRRPRLQDADVRHRAGGSRPGHLRDGEPPDPQGPR